MTRVSCERSYDRLMRVTRIWLLIVTAALLIAAPAQAGKTKVYAPPGKAGTSEYSEVVPTSGGNAQTPAMGGGNQTAAQISKIGAGRAGVRKLSKLGKQGLAAATLAQETAPVVVRSAHGLGGNPTGAGSVRLGGASSGSALGGVGHLLAGSDAGGIGLFLPLLLAFGLGLAVATAVVRLRRGHESGPPGA